LAAERLREYATLMVASSIVFGSGRASPFKYDNHHPVGDSGVASFYRIRNLFAKLSVADPDPE
jgi:hypothetical protein